MNKFILTSLLLTGCVQLNCKDSKDHSVSVLYQPVKCVYENKDSILLASIVAPIALLSVLYYKIQSDSDYEIGSLDLIKLAIFGKTELNENARGKTARIRRKLRRSKIKKTPHMKLNRAANILLLATRISLAAGLSSVLANLALNSENLKEWLEKQKENLALIKFKRELQEKGKNLKEIEQEECLICRGKCGKYIVVCCECCVHTCGTCAEQQASTALPIASHEDLVPEFHKIIGWKCPFCRKIDKPKQLNYPPGHRFQLTNNAWRLPPRISPLRRRK
ncbi:hypothetical protein ACFLY6_03275 [Candidatus Dependentiae bacterium]